MLKFRPVALLAGLTLLGSACGPEAAAPQEPQVMSWEEFRASVYQGEDGIFVLNGDEAIEGEDKLYDWYKTYIRGEGEGSHAGALAVYYSGGDVKWSSSQALNLTYCVSTTFGSNYSKVVQSMSAAAGAWEGAARVNFIHVSSQDSNCSSRNANVVFDVSPVNTGGRYLARAFFPNTSRSGRNVLIDNSAFSPSAPGLDGILRHELGHTLGFRHEHTRPEAGACYEDNQWRGLTPYDSSSVMHYPQCNGTNNWNLSMTRLDKQGAGILYP